MTEKDNRNERQRLEKYMNIVPKSTKNEAEVPLAVERGVPLNAQKLSGERQKYSDHFFYDSY